MYNPIFAKSFSRHDRKRFGCFALLFSFLIALSIFSTFNPTLHRPFSIIGDAVRLQLSINALQDLLTDDGISYSPTQTFETSNVETKPPQLHQKPPENGAQNTLLINTTVAAAAETELKPQEKATAAVSEPPCRVGKHKPDYCEMEGDVRVDSNSSTVFLIRPGAAAASWSIQPYSRKGIASVKKWTVKLAAAAAVPECTRTHSHPAILFSTRGFAGNFFHDFSDLLLPLFSTSFHYQRNVHFLAADRQPWWLSKYRPLLHQLTRHDILDINHETDHVHCYGKLTAGLRYHRELVADRGMSQFRHLLRRAYSLDRNKSTVWTKDGGKPLPPPRLIIVPRKRTRILINEAQISLLARKLGYEVVSTEGDVPKNLTKFAQLVNSCDVMMGVHGAGLTNMVFLPERAVVIQVVPLGAIDKIAKLDFGDPAAGMKIRYLDYKIELNESSLLQRYSIDHPVIKDPMSVHREGWAKLSEIYLRNQNVTIDVARFRPTLAKALELLGS